MALLDLKVVPMADYGKGLNTSGMSFGMPKNKKDEEDEEKDKSSGIWNMFSGGGSSQPAQTTPRVNDSSSVVDTEKQYAVADIVDPATYTGDLNAPGGVLDTILSFTVPGYSILRNLKAMEDPDKYGKGTAYGYMMGYGDKKGLLTGGNPFSGLFGGSTIPATNSFGGVDPNYTSTNSYYGGYNYAPTSYGTYGSQAYNNLGFGQANSFADDTSTTSPSGSYDTTTSFDDYDAGSWESSGWDDIG